MTLQSVHPFDNQASVQSVTIPDAQALEIRLDEVTQMHDQVGERGEIEEGRSLFAVSEIIMLEQDRFLLQVEDEISISH